MAAISADEPNKIIGIRKESPLIVRCWGIQNRSLHLMCLPILEHTNNVIYLNDNEMVIWTLMVLLIKDMEGNILDKEINTIEWTSDMAEKGGYKTFHLKEIHEQPDVVKNTLMEFSEIEKVVAKFTKFNRICFVACGTSYHASNGWEIFI